MAVAGDADPQAAQAGDGQAEGGPEAVGEEGREDQAGEPEEGRG
jgi:hypothetical protein